VGAQGTDYVYPHDEQIRAYLKRRACPDADISINYTPFGH
jgi:hypothetical protein